MAADPPSETAPKPETKPADAAPAAVDVLVEVLERGVEIGGHKKALGRRERLPLADAKTLEGLGKVKILGI